MTMFMTMVLLFLSILMFVDRGASLRKSFSKSFSKKEVINDFNSLNNVLEQLERKSGYNLNSGSVLKSLMFMLLVMYTMYYFLSVLFLMTNFHINAYVLAVILFFNFCIVFNYWQCLFNILEAYNGFIKKLLDVKLNKLVCICSTAAEFLYAGIILVCIIIK